MCGDQKDPLDRLQNGNQARQKQEKVLDKDTKQNSKELEKTQNREGEITGYKKRPLEVNGCYGDG